MTETLRDGRYVVTAIIGEGGQGTTFAAVDKQHGRMVAVKRFRVKGARSWKDVELAEREAQVLARLSHPLLPGFVEHFEENGALYLVMELIEGETAASQVLAGPSDRDEVVRFLYDVAAVLEHLHQQRPALIHRDIKPGNVIRRGGSYVLVDFGSVRDRLKTTGGSTVSGTFGYMAPEQLHGRALPETDLYGAGTTALALLTGREPETLPHKGLGIDVPRALAGVRDDKLVALLAQLVEPDPDRRPPRLLPLLAALGPRPGAPSRKPPSEPPTKPPKPARVRRRRRRLPPFVGAFLALGIAIGRMAVALSLLVVVPLILTLLLQRRAAGSVRDAGQRALAAMRRAQDFVSGGETIRRIEVPGIRIDVQPESDVVDELGRRGPSSEKDELGRRGPSSKRDELGRRGPSSKGEEDEEDVEAPRRRQRRR